MKSFELVSNIALALLDLDRIDDGMNYALEAMGAYLGVSRVYIFQDTEDGSATSNVYEWCGKGIEPQIDSLQNIPYSAISSWDQMLRTSGLIRSENIAELPSDVRAVLEPQGIQSIVVYPLLIENEKAGFIGFDECGKKRKWGDLELNLLKSISGILSGAFERKRGAERKRQAEENFQTFFETVGDLFAISDASGSLLYANRALVDRLGYTLAELRSLRFADLQKAGTGELSAKSGEAVPVDARRWNGTWDGRGCVFHIAKDLSSDHDSLLKFSKLFQNNPAVMAISELPSSAITDVNDSFVRLLGFSREEVVGKTVGALNLFPVRDQRSVILKAIGQEGRIRDFDVRIRRKDGSPLYGVFSGEIIETRGKRYFMSALVDVTEKAALTEKLADQKKRLEHIIDSTGLGTWEWNVQTGETIFNERWAEIAGYTLAELSPVSIRTWASLVHPDDLPGSDEKLRAHFDRKTDHYEYECRMRRRGGGWVWVLDTGRVIDWDKDGRPLRMFGTHLDITERKKSEMRLRETERRFNLALDGAEAGLWDWDMAAGTVYYSPLWKRMLGYAEDEIGNTAEEWKSRWHPDDAPLIARAMDDYLAGRKSAYEVSYRIRHKDGSWRWFLTRGALLKDESGKPYRWVGTNIDITEEKERSEELERFFSVNLDLLCIADVEGRFLKVNKAWSDILGYSVAELENRRFLDFVHPDDVEPTLAAMARLSAAEEVLKFVNRYRHRDGTYRFIEWRSHPYGRLIYAAARDITERIEFENRLTELSIRDALTGLYNRRFLLDFLGSLIAETKRNGTRFAASIVDLDHFKAVNDTYGHQAGDFVLKEFGALLSRNTRPYDFVGRYGGEEFLVVFKDLDKKSAEPILARVLEELRETTLRFEGSEIRCTFSGGISDSAELSDGALCSERIIELADSRLYQAKRAGRDRIIID